MPQKPTPGRVVQYVLADGDVALIESQHPMATSRRNPVTVGDVYPATVVRVFDPSTTTVNLQVALDGDCSYWATSRAEGDEPGTWHWPTRQD